MDLILLIFSINRMFDASALTLRNSSTNTYASGLTSSSRSIAKIMRITLKASVETNCLHAAAIHRRHLMMNRLSLDLSRINAKMMANS